MADATPSAEPSASGTTPEAAIFVDTPPEIEHVDGSREIVVQACAMAVADAVAYLRNTEIIANAVIGAAMERLLTDKDPQAARAAIDAAQASVTAATAALAAIGAAATQALDAFAASELRASEALQ